MMMNEPVEPTEPRVLIPVPEGSVEGEIYGTLEQRDHWDESIWR